MEEEAPSVSVILPTFNRERYIRAAISSILEQSSRVREIIVVDDGSTDGTAAACAEFAQQVRYVRQPENRGKTAAINRGLALATADYIWIMDDDDIAPSDALEQLLRPLTENPKPGFSYGRLQKFTEDERGACAFDPPQAFPVDGERSFFARLMEDCFITGQPCVLVRKACFDEIAPLDESVQVSVDYNILLQLARRYDAACVDQVVLWQRQHLGMRGPKANSYRESERVQRWMQSDARLLRQLLRDLRLPEYLGLRSRSVRLTPLQRRQALFQKAAIAARKNLWDIAFPALADALAADSKSPLTPPNLAALQNMLGCRYGIDEFIFDPAKQAALVKAAGRSPLATEVRYAVGSRLTYWIGDALRRGDLRRFSATCCTLARISGVSAVRLCLAPIEKRMMQLFRATEADRRRDDLQAEDCEVRSGA
ncbi:MAG TPA: glycosyltransferase family 2 protein [Caulobacteraceae bacterium]|nr:glycosyltransferase family 2 protein [Caulobacteraceae bacterium]